MPRLILLNGPPGIGKSTLAQRYVEEHPLALNLDVDRVRSLIGRWREHPQEAGMLARDAALAMAGTHLRAGHDVIVAQYLGRVAFIEQLEELAAEVGARFDEVVLLDTKEESLRRFAQRTAAAAAATATRSGAVTDPAHADPAHADPAHLNAHALEAQAMVDRDGGPAALEAMYDRLIAVLQERPHAKVVHTRDGQIARAYDDLVGRLA